MTTMNLTEFFADSSVAQALAMTQSNSGDMVKDDELMCIAQKRNKQVFSVIDLFHELQEMSYGD